MEKVVLQPGQNARLDIVLQSSGSDVPEAPKQLAYSSEVKVVSLLATVRDQEGRVVKNLTQDDFAVEDDGVPQKIRYFTYEPDLPLKIGLLVDTSRSETYRLDSERAASFTFLDSLLRPEKDQAFVARFDVKTAVLTGLTSSREELSSALDQLRTPPGYGTVIFTAIRDCSRNVMQKEDGRKALILLTDGVDHFEHTSIETAIEHAQGADCILYPIRIFDAWPLATPLGIAVWHARLAKARKGLARMALETGGEEFEVSKGSTIQDIYTRIEEALRNQYSIGYVPDPAGQTGKYHKVKLTPKDPHLVVRSRAGYYGK
jgi:VWFA-related protein